MERRERLVWLLCGFLMGVGLSVALWANLSMGPTPTPLPSEPVKGDSGEEQLTKMPTPERQWTITIRHYPEQVCPVVCMDTDLPCGGRFHLFAFKDEECAEQFYQLLRVGFDNARRTPKVLDGLKEKP